MKKTILTLLIILSSIMIFSFSSITTETSDIKITVTSDTETQFDMLQKNKTLKGLKTPYEFTVTAEDNLIIFKPQDLKTNLKIKAKKNQGGVSGEYLITVLLIDSDKITITGID